MTPQEKQNVINQIASGAMECWKTYHILPSLTISQCLLESGWLSKTITVVVNGVKINSFNAFGIKADSSWKGEFVTVPTKEFYNNKWVIIQARFRKYPNLASSILDHGKFLQTPRYAKVRQAKNYIEACTQVRLAGYATNPNYSKLLISVIESNNLQKYDQIAQAPMPIPQPQPRPTPNANIRPTKI